MLFSLARVEKVAQPYGYTAREQDEESDLYYYRARYYDPNTGRFVSEDPIGFDGNDYNLYRYVSSNPVNLIDPSGLIGLSDIGNFSERVIGDTRDYIC